MPILFKSYGAIFVRVGVCMRLLWLVVFSFISSCGDPLCENTLISDALSSDGRYTASVFERNCGATTSSVFVVSLRHAEDEFNPLGDNWIFTVHDKTPIYIKWHGTSLHVDYVQVFDKPTKVNKWKDVSIKYGLYSPELPAQR